MSRSPSLRSSLKFNQPLLIAELGDRSVGSYSSEIIGSGIHYNNPVTVKSNPQYDGLGELTALPYSISFGKISYSIVNQSTGKFLNNSEVLDLEFTLNVN